MTQELIEIIRYPIKSTAGLKVKQTALSSQGIEMDRLFALVNAEGIVVTARQYPQLNLLNVVTAEDSLVIEYYGEYMRFALVEGLKRSIRHYSSTFESQTISPEFDRWVSDFIDEPVQLVRNDPDDKRQMHKYNRPEQEIRMVDAAPILLINQPSVDRLNEGISPAVHRDVFRANLVISAESEQEYKHNTVQIGDLMFDIVAPCTRCKLTTITEDSLSFRQDGEPLRSLSQMNNGKAIFGVYIVPRSEGQLTLGAKVKFS